MSNDAPPGWAAIVREGEAEVEHVLGLDWQVVERRGEEKKPESVREDFESSGVMSNNEARRGWAVIIREDGQSEHRLLGIERHAGFRGEENKRKVFPDDFESSGFMSSDAPLRCAAIIPREESEHRPFSFGIEAQFGQKEEGKVVPEDYAYESSGVISSDTRRLGRTF